MAMLQEVAHVQFAPVLAGDFRRLRQLDWRTAIGYDLLMTEDPPSIQSNGYIDAVVDRGEWLQWRDSQSHPPERLREAAIAWCKSPLWNRCTPWLEDWKQIVQDICPGSLSADELAQMAGANSRGICFPPIPLFEAEQAYDMIGGLLDPLAVAVFAEQLAAVSSFLPAGEPEMPRACWEKTSPNVRQRIEYPAWRWLVFVPEPIGGPWPSRREFDALLQIQGSRRDEALQRLEAAARQSGQAGDHDAEAVLEWFAEIAGKEDATGSGSAGVLTGSIAAQPGNEPAPPDLERLCRALFEGPLDRTQWKAVEALARGRGPGAAEAHPLSAMTQYLREQNIPEEQDAGAWEKLKSVLTECGGLLDVPEGGGSRPLPALELAASVLSTVSIGNVAVELIDLARTQKEKADWWRALRAGLEPKVRRDRSLNVNDRVGPAIDRINWRCTRNWLKPAEKQAFEIGFAQEIR
jgi:hypothetical protein